MLHTAALRYRVMAYITGVLIIVVCFVGIPLQVAAHNTFIVNDIGTVHGVLYIIYIIFAYILSQKLKMKTGPTVLLLLAGTVPIMTFFVERWMSGPTSPPRWPPSPPRRNSSPWPVDPLLHRAAVGRAPPGLGPGSAARPVPGTRDRLGGLLPRPPRPRHPVAARVRAAPARVG
jgi:integral membrane protein